MGRELRRVPLDFDHPIGETWPGYLRPDYRPCPNEHCDDSCRGYTTAERYLEGIAYLISMAGDAASETKPLHPWLEGIPVAYGKARPSPDIVEFIKAIAPKWEPGSFGGGNYEVYRGLLKVAGLPEDWGQCTTCDGHGIHPDDIEASEAWESTAPPEGPGYQMWETTSEGSPKTPVFDTLKELAEYCAQHCTTFASLTASAEGWEQMLSDGFVSARIAPNIIAM